MWDTSKGWEKIMAVKTRPHVVLDIAYEESGPADGVPVILAASGTSS
jgi:hypothetical protein